MQKIFVTYNLKPGVSLEQYKAWSREIDQRIAPGQPGVIRFEVYVIEGALDGEQRFQIMEDIEVESVEAWQKALAGEGMAYVMETFPMFVDTSSVNACYGTRFIADLPHGARPPLPAQA
ncbi:hypothetical protein O9Z70_00030 [Devosia sp. YIM 151766]|uniref:hypothetical protein n=1 Tax=Devosia sp. YIM 151766 TaxID=3017325 RepID=UPI00255D0AB3|nr:hypothetical protein [Devosia sp. YIM 151766]WIY52975.1 hypothetical protein O9Z70_00030 [Devosia sp. YIM 151766]